METATLRPTANHFQYLHYDSKQKKLASKSKIIASFREEAIDTNGTVRCGKPVSSQLRDNPELKERWADVTCFRQVRGLVSGKGKTVDGAARSGTSSAQVVGQEAVAQEVPAQ